MVIILIASVGPYFWGSDEQFAFECLFQFSSVLWLYSKYAFTYKRESIALSLCFPEGSQCGKKCVNKKPSCHSVARPSSQRSSEVPYFPISFMRVHCASLKKPNRDECSEMNIKCKKLCPSPNCLKTPLTAVSWFLLPGLSSCYIYGDEAV